jgi:hypothetical protein
MRVTKAMKEFVEESLNKKRLEKNKEFSAAYDERKNKAYEEIKNLLPELYDKIDDVLIKYNMDLVNQSRYESKGRTSEEIIRGIYDAYIRNQKEFDEIRDFERKIYDKQQEMIKRFILECDLGIDKEEFFKKVEEMSF